MKNRYCKSSKLSERQFRALVKCFSVDLTATQAARMTGLNRNTVNRYLRLIRGRIAARCERESPFAGTVEVDESYFGARRVRGKRGRGATDKTPVFGIFERGGRVYTEVVPNCKKATLQAIIRGKIAPDSLVNSDGWRGYDGLVDMGYGHRRVNHSKDEFARPDGTHINGIEGFWGLAKVRLARFRGMAPQAFWLHLKECEWRLNNRGENLGRLVLKICRLDPLI